MNNKNGFSLVEVLVSIVIASILILTIGIISSIANGTYNKLSKEQSIYNDISYAFKLMQNKIHMSSTLAVGSNPSPWITNQHFVVDGGTFGLYQTSATAKDLIYVSGGTTETLLTVPQPGTITLSMAITSGKYITITLSGKKDNIPFQMETAVLRRN